MMTAVLPKSVARHRYAGRIEDFSDERDNRDGYWIYLKPGWCNGDQGSHIIHEDTIGDLVKWLAMSLPCNCPDCRRD